VPTRSTSRFEGSGEVAQVVAALERQYDAFVAAQENRSLLARDEDLPSGDELGAEFERVPRTTGRRQVQRERQLTTGPTTKLATLNRDTQVGSDAAANGVGYMTKRSPTCARAGTDAFAGVPHHSRIPARVPGGRLGPGDPD